MVPAAPAQPADRPPADASPDPDVRRAAVVVNPSKVDLRRLRATVEAAERDHGWSASAWFETDAADDGRDAARRALASAPDVVLVVGGDGTVRVVAEVLRGSGVPFALVPLGTGNLFARNLRMRLGDVPAAVRVAFTGADRPIDLAVAELTPPQGPVTSHAFLVMAGIGLDASMAAHTNATAKRRLGWLAYSDPIARSVLGNKHFDLRYRLDDGPARPLRAHTVIVGNCGTLTANVLLLPDARIDDGLLDAVAFRPKGGFGWTKVGYGLTFNRFFHRTRFGRLLFRVLPTSRALRYISARRLSIELDEPEEIQLDGDPFGTVIAATLTVEHHALLLRTA